MNNFYNSPKLADFLKSNEIEYDGTLCVKRKKLLPLGERQKEKGGQYVRCHRTQSYLEEHK
jgi:hypothetical protein